MIQRLKNNWLILFVIVFLSAAYLQGVSEVPFHPDESTQLFMSADVEMFFENPSSLYWQPDNEQDLRQHYRELDAPLTRYVAGLGRQITHQSPLPADWDWSSTWGENQLAGALPDPGLLQTGRLSVAVFFPLSLFLLYKTAQKIGGPVMAWLSIFFFASNALILLHTRRVMAESLLVFTILLTLYIVTHLEKHRWLIAIPAALAFSSKQSAAALLLMGLIIVLWPGQEKEPFRSTNKLARVSSTAQYLLTGLIILFLLNPFLWAHPLQAGLSAWDTRQTLASNQITTIAEKNPEKILNSIPERTLGIVFQLFINPPAVEDVANYQEQTLESAAAYLNNPLNSLYRGIVWGGILLVLSIFGFFTALVEISHKKDTSRWKPLVFLLLASALQFLSLIFLFTLPFQRYVIPLVPFTSIWQAYGLSTILKSVQPADSNLPGISTKKNSPH